MKTGSRCDTLQLRGNSTGIEEQRDRPESPNRPFWQWMIAHGDRGHRNRYLAWNQRIVLTQSRNMMSIEWSSEIKEMLGDARHLSERLGHFEIVTLTHVYGVLLSRLHGRNGNDVATTLATIDPPWPTDSVYLSPGGQTPTLKRAIENAVVQAQSESREVTIRDIWEALPNGHAETVRYLDRTFGIDR